MLHAGSRDNFYSCLKDVVSSSLWGTLAGGDTSKKHHHLLMTVKRAGSEPAVLVTDQLGV